MNLQFEKVEKISLSYSLGALNNDDLRLAVS